MWRGRKRERRLSTASGIPSGGHCICCPACCLLSICSASSAYLQPLSYLLTISPSWAALMSVGASRSKLAASVLAGVDNIHIKPGAKVLYLGAASGTSVSHVSDIVGPDGAVYAVEFSHRSGELLHHSKTTGGLIMCL